jgi:hypothetical protein
MSNEVKITTKGITSTLKRLKFNEKNFFKSIAQYVWNGFDAQATRIDLNYAYSSSGILKQLIIKDNGYGINHDELLAKFEPIFVSEKAANSANNKNTSTYHGKNGIGRFTFFTFANDVRWSTVYGDNKQNFKYSIEISANRIEFFTGLETTPDITNDSVGTIVEFTNFRRLKRKSKDDAKSVESEMVNYLKREFCWYLELNKCNVKLYLNGTELDYSSLIKDKSDFEIVHSPSNTTFNIRYVQWLHFLENEYSKFYYLNQNNKELYKEYTTLNNKGDSFYHSLFISSQYFEDFNFNSTEKSSQKNMTGGCRSDEIYKYLIRELNVFLRNKRKPFLREYAQKMISKFEDEGIISRKNKDEFELIQIDDLEEVVQELYTTQPSIFHKLKKEQNQILIGLLNLVLNSDERENVLEIIDQIVKLEYEERKELCDILKVTNMSKIIKTMNLIKDRFKILELLSEILFNRELKANEVDHLQKIVENHTWIFGEKYSLVAAAEDNFEKALNKHLKILRNSEDDVHINHPDKYKQVDIFICRQEKRYNTVHNLIIELKHPTKAINEKYLSQVKTYMRTILGIDQFNGETYTWDFYLIGNKFDSNGYIEGEIKSNMTKGQPGLVHSQDKFNIYVRKWCDILNECDLRHQFLQDRLEIEKSKLFTDLESPNEAVELAKNSAVVK